MLRSYERHILRAPERAGVDLQDARARAERHSPRRVHVMALQERHVYLHALERKFAAREGLATSVIERRDHYITILREAGLHCSPPYRVTLDICHERQPHESLSSMMFMIEIIYGRQHITIMETAGMRLPRATEAMLIFRRLRGERRSVGRCCQRACAKRASPRDRRQTAGREAWQEVVVGVVVARGEKEVRAVGVAGGARRGRRRRARRARRHALRDGAAERCRHTSAQRVATHITNMLAFALRRRATALQRQRHYR